MEILYPFIYPITSQELTSVDSYVQPHDTCMVYSRGDIYVDKYYLPDRLFTGGVDGQTRVFSSPHVNNDGLYAAFIRASQVVVVDSTLYAFEDVSIETVGIKIAGNIVTIGYIGVVDNTFHSVGPLLASVASSPNVSENMVTPTVPGTVSIRQQMQGRYTAEVNNLPKTVTTVVFAGSVGVTQTYLPPEGTMFSFVTIEISNQSTEEIITFLNFIQGGVPTLHIFTLPPKGEVKLDNLVILGSELVTLQFSAEGAGVKVSSVNMVN